MPPHDPPARTALVLSGGGLKGLAHVGAWKALAEANVRPDFIVGSSIGAFIGAAIAGGIEIEEMERRARTVTQNDIAVVSRRTMFPFGVKQPSVLRGDVFRDFVADVLPCHNFHQLPIPLHVGAVDLQSGSLEWFGMGGSPHDDSDPSPGVVEAVAASCALPTKYPPVEIDGRYYVDAGVIDTFPIERALELGAHRVIGVDVTTLGELTSAQEVVEGGMLAISSRVFGLMANQRRRALIEQWEGPDLVHVRPDVEGIDGFSFDHNDYLVDEGCRATRRALRAAEVVRPHPRVDDDFARDEVSGAGRRILPR